MLRTRLTLAVSLLFCVAGLGQAQPDLTNLDNYPNPTDPNGCTVEGNPNSNALKRASNTLKNRFLIPSNPDPMSMEEIKALPFLENGQVPSIASQAAHRPVKLIGYVVAVSNGGGSESCNCKASGPGQIDAHIDLVLYPNEEQADKKRRDFVVAEVTERMRRLAAGGFTTGNIGNDWSTSILKSKLKGRWVEFTGYLFYDDDHLKESWNFDPKDSIQPNNWRSTSWEIHPVTGIRVLDGRPSHILPHKPNFKPDNSFILAPVWKERINRRKNKFRRHK